MAQTHEVCDYLIDFEGKYGPRYRIYAKNVVTGALRLLTPMLDNGKGFPSKQQEQFFDSKAPYTLFAGSRGPGKSSAITYDLLYGAYLVPGSKQICFRRTMGELEKTIIAKMKEFPENLVGRYHGEPGNEHFLLPCMNNPPCTKSPCEHSSYIYFGSAPTEESVRKMLSGEYYRVYFDEWTEFPLSMWRFIVGSMRTPRDKDVLGRPIIAQCKGCSNPGGVGGDALNHLFGCEVEKGVPIGDDTGDTYDPNDYLYIHTTIDDNPAYASDRPAGKAYRKILAAQPPNIRASWIDGKWSGFEGQYFTNFGGGYTVKVPHDDALRMIAKQYWQPVVLGGDWGQVHYAYYCNMTFLELPLIDGSKHTFPIIFQEFMHKGMSEKALAEEICDAIDDKIKRRTTRFYMSPETFGETDRSRAKKMGDVMVTYRMPRPQAAVNERVNGFRTMYGLLDERWELPQGTGWNPDSEGRCIVSGLLIDASCEVLIEALPWAVADKTKDGDILHSGDHPFLDVLDGSRYVLHSTAIKGKDKSRDDKFKDKINSLPVSGMDRYAEYLKRVKELREEKRGQGPLVGRWSRDRHPRIGGRRR